ncbi:MAG: LLM class F420-dependent oxidoreductase [Myxococcales bacterium]|nr:LLM class F420-dependent oxidoreductase [Myxococcales bacterium]
MKIDSGLMGSLDAAPERARALEADGFDGLITAEMAHDPFLPLVLAAEHTERIEIMTSIAVGFARNPMLLANLGHDLNAYSQGRFILGLGSQIKPHITKRFSMPWSHPAARMREMILAVRAIWDGWYEGKPLAFEGDFYSHTLMTPMFTPTDTEHGPARIFLAAVGPRMTEVAGEVADGMIVHAFTTEKYLREVTLPAIDAGLAKAGRDRATFTLTFPCFVVTGANEKEWEASRTGIARQIAFYGSTPAYRPVLERHGWGELQTELNVLSKQGQWAEMGTLVSDEILETFAIVAEPDQVAMKLDARFGDVIDRVMCGFDFLGGEARRAAMDSLRG